MKEKLIELLNSYWTFDSNQWHTHTWHDKQDCIAKIEELFTQDRAGFCSYCGKYKTTQGNGIAHQLCECGY